MCIDISIMHCAPVGQLNQFENDLLSIHALPSVMNRFETSLS